MAPEVYFDYRKAEKAPMSKQKWYQRLMEQYAKPSLEPKAPTSHRYRKHLEKRFFECSRVEARTLGRLAPDTCECSAELIFLQKDLQ
jgi:hypothetical protein